MRKIYFYFLAFTLILSVTGSAQNKLTSPVIASPSDAAKICGFDILHEEKIKNDTQYKKITDDFNEMLSSGTAPLQKRGALPIYQVPVVVHILHVGETVGTGYNISDDQVKAGIKYLNNYWRKVAGTYGDGPGVDMEIEFSLAVRDPSGNCTNGIVRRDMSGNSTYVSCGVSTGTCGITDTDAKTGRWDTQNYYNIYLVNEIDGANCFTGGSYTAGYAYFASAHGQTYDGTVCLICSYVDEASNTMAHEIGHAWNLYHTFEGGSSSACPASETTSNCASQGDRCCDTRPHQTDDCSSTTCTGPGTDANSFYNYMSYCNTTERFTADQKTRATAAMTNTSTRGKFLAANGNNKLVPPGAPTVDFSAGATAICLNSSVTFTDESFCIPNTYATNTGWPNITFSWSVTGPATLSSTLQNPSFTFVTAGTYDVSLTVNVSGTNYTATKTGYIRVSNSPATACTPNSTNVGNYAQTIYNVTFNEINSSTSSLTNAAYTNYACSNSTIVTEGSTYQLSVSLSAGGSGREYCLVWIDYDNDGVIDTGEEVMNGSTPTTNTTSVITANITIPTTAVENTLLRMRVMGECNSAVSTNDKTCAANYFIGDVEDYSILISPPLPITLLSFDAIVNQDNHVELHWITATEINNIGYDVERSSDLKSFTNIAFVQGSGNSTSPKSYSFIDEAIKEKDIYYYRLKQKDYDGKFEYFGPIAINFDLEGKFSLDKISPNPAENSINLIFKGKYESASFKIVNITGQVLMNKDLPDTQDNIHELSIENLSPGMYFIEVQTKTEKFLKKFVKL